MNLALKSLAEEESAFNKAAPMLFGDEFAKRATNQVEVVTAINKLARPGQEEQHHRRNCVFVYHPQIHQVEGRRVGIEAAMGCSPPTSGTQGTNSKEETSQDTRTNFFNLCCEFKSIVQLTHLMRELSSIKREITTIVHAG